MRDQVTSRNLLEHLKKQVPYTYGVLLIGVLAADLQVAQPTNVAEPMLRAYNKGLHAEDRLSWQTIFRNQVLTPNQVWKATASSRAPLPGTAPADGAAAHRACAAGRPRAGRLPRRGPPVPHPGPR